MPTCEHVPSREYHAEYCHLGIPPSMVRIMVATSIAIFIAIFIANNKTMQTKTQTVALGMLSDSLWNKWE